MKISNKRFKQLTQLDLFLKSSALDVENAKESLKRYNANLRAKKRERRKNKTK